MLPSLRRSARGAAPFLVAMLSPAAALAAEATPAEDAGAAPTSRTVQRATPGVFSAAADVDRLADAIRAIALAVGPGIRP